MHAETRSLSRPGHQLRLDAERFLATLVRANYIPDVVPAKPGPYGLPYTACPIMYAEYEPRFCLPQSCSENITRHGLAPHFCALKYFKSGGDWSFLVGIK